MSEQLPPITSEAWHPPFKSSAQLVEAFVERYAVEDFEENDEYIRHASTYPMAADSLGIVTLGEADVTFEKTVGLDTDGSVEYTAHSIFIGTGSDIVFTMKAYGDNDKLWGGYGDLGFADDPVIDSEAARPFLQRLAANMWLHDMRLTTPMVDEDVAIRAVKHIVDTLACNPSHPDYPEADRSTSYPIEPGRNIWTTLKAERWYASEDTLNYGLSITNSYDDEITVGVAGDTGELYLNNFAGADIEGAERNRHIQLVLTALAGAMAKGETPGVTPPDLAV